MSTRHVRLHWRSPARPDGGRGYAQWVRDLRGHNGVYVIRDATTHEVYYVGESHKGRLFETLTRHFQSWSGFGAGPTYNAGAVEVAALETTADDARYEQFELIMHFRPLDNQKDGRSLFTDAYAPAESTRRSSSGADTDDENLPAWVTEADPVPDENLPAWVTED